MSRVVLRLSCAAGDADIIAEVLRDHLHAPVHLRREEVLGRDFDDAATGERVAGSLARAAIEVELAPAQVADAVEAARTARRRLPFRWRTIAVLDGGRVE